MIAVGATEVRNLKAGERLPQDLCIGFPSDWEFDPEWTWVAVEADEIVAFMLGAPCHGVAQMIMLSARKGFGTVLPRVLRAFLRDCSERGFRGYMVHLNHDKPEQYKLMKIAQRAGGIVLPSRIICVGGKIVDAMRY